MQIVVGQPWILAKKGVLHRRTYSSFTFMKSAGMIATLS
jgi:hypothetical protein